MLRANEEAIYESLKNRKLNAMFVELPIFVL